MFQQDTQNQDEILDVKWFTYDEIVNMRDELRGYWIIDTIKTVEDNKTADIDLITVY